ncbi:MAG: hypothetical protein WCV88_01115 [Patescibacteria group bacterium]|jgi:hypothetical protein
MRILIKRNIIELIGLSWVVILSVGIAYGLEWIVVHYSTITAASAHLLFALTLPLVLFILQQGMRKLMHQPRLAGGVNIVLPKTLDVNPETLRSVEGITKKLQDHFRQMYAINQIHVCIFDWKRKQYQAVFDKFSYLLPQNHALVYFAKHFHSIYTTERRSPLADEMSDVMHAEMLVFMQKHKFAFMLPLYTTTDVYGFAFFRLDEIKDSKLLIEADQPCVNQIGLKFGQQLQQVLIYDAIVLHNQKRV